jgi:hypothetical protein
MASAFWRPKTCTGRDIEGDIPPAAAISAFPFVARIMMEIA